MSTVRSSVGSEIVTKDAPQSRLGVNLYAPVGVQSGLGTAARGYLAALRQAGIAVSLVPVHELFVHQRSVGRKWPRQRARHPISIAHVNADSVDRFLHYHGRDFQRAQYRIGIWAWELPALPDVWVRACDHFDEIWVPSQFCQRAVQAVTGKPVIVMPHVVQVEPDSPAVLRTTARGVVTFLYVFDAFGIVERKNPHALVVAFTAEFARSEAVRLMLKVSNLSASPELADDLARLAACDPRVEVLRHSMETPELAALMRRCDCYVSPHRSEGFGLTVAEAMSLGVPVIATDYGGTADFVTEETGFPLHYRLVEIAQDHGPYGKGGIWAEPSQAHLQRLLRGVVADPAKAAAKGFIAQARVASAHSAAAVGARIVERLSAWMAVGS